MGYTHYFQVKDPKSRQWRNAWPQLVKDTRRIIEAAGVELSTDDDPDEPTDDIGKLVDIKNGIHLNGVESDGHETLVIEPDSGEWSFVKTVQKPYDVVVACVLLRAYMLAPAQFKLSSDGLWDEEWQEEARPLYSRLWREDVVTCPWADEVPSE